MTQLPPSGPRPSRNRDLGFDEFVAMLVAFGAIGAILWWGLSRKEPGFNWVEEVSPPAAVGAGSFLNELTIPEGNASQASGITGSIQAHGDQPPQDDIPDSTPNPELRQPPVVLPGIVNPGTPAPAVIGVVPPPTLVVPPPQANPVEFSDVPADYWARPFIAALAQRGIITGFANGTFQPNQPVTRAEYAALIEKVFQPQNTQAPIAFKDVPADFWATPAIDTAVKIGFLKGYPEGVFQPNQPISRAQLLASLVNGLQISQPTAPADVVKLYRDNAQIPAWAVPAAASATQAGLVVNYPALDTLNPNQPATRAELAAVVYQSLVGAGKLDSIPSDYIVRP